MDQPYITKLEGNTGLGPYYAFYERGEFATPLFILTEVQADDLFSQYEKLREEK